MDFHYLLLLFPGWNDTQYYGIIYAHKYCVHKLGIVMDFLG